jgi:uncharacterized protein with PIN domain
VIAVDTSALMAIVLGEPQGEACMTAIEEAEQLLIYEVATEHDCPLLYVGDDFGQTDVRSAL